MTSRRTPAPPGDDEDANVRMSVGDPIGLSLRDSDDWRHATTPPPQQQQPPPPREAPPQPSVRKGATGVRTMAERFSLKNDLLDEEDGQEGADESPFPFPPPPSKPPPPPLAAEKNEVFGDLLGADDDDSSEEEEAGLGGGASDSEEDLVETFGDGALPPKPPPPPPPVASRAAGVKKRTGGAAGHAAVDEWAAVATNATESTAAEAAATATAGAEASVEAAAAAAALDDLKPSEDAVEGFKELGSARMDGYVHTPGFVSPFTVPLAVLQCSPGKEMARHGRDACTIGPLRSQCPNTPSGSFPQPLTKPRPRRNVFFLPSVTDFRSARGI